MMSDDTAKKFDNGKTRFDLIELQLYFGARLSEKELDEVIGDYLQDADVSLNNAVGYFSDWFSNKNSSINLVDVWIEICCTRFAFTRDFTQENFVRANAYCSDSYGPNTILGLLSTTVGPMVFGESKYGTYNWKLGLPVSKFYSAAIRHVIGHYESVWDKESGLLHLDHIAANVMMAAWTAKDRPEMDDRFIKPNSLNVVQ